MEDLRLVCFPPPPRSEGLGGDVLCKYSIVQVNRLRCGRQGAGFSHGLFPRGNDNGDGLY